MADRGNTMISLYMKHPEVHQTLKKGQWSHGLYGCFDNMGMCMIAFCIPCVLWGQTAEQLGKTVDVKTTSQQRFMHERQGRQRFLYDQSLA